MSLQADQDKLRAWLTLLNQASGLKKNIDRRLSKEFGISLSRFDVLAALERGGKEGLKAGALTKKLVVSDGNTTQVTNKLVRDGLVRRYKDKDDGRVVIYALTAKGAKLFKSMATKNRHWVSDAFSGLDGDDLHQLRNLLSKINIHSSQKQDPA